MSIENTEQSLGDSTFLESFQAFMGNAAPPERHEVENTAPEVQELKASEPHGVETIKRTPLEEIDSLAETPDFILPTDEKDGEDETLDVATSSEEDKDNPYQTGTPQHRRFAEMRKETVELKRTLDSETQSRAQTESRLKEFEAKAARADELEVKVKEYESKLTLTDITESELYQTTVVEPYKDILRRSKDLAKRTGIDHGELARALEITDIQERREVFTDLVSGLGVDIDDEHEMRDLASEVQPLIAKRKAIYENADQALAEIETARTRQQQEELLINNEIRKTTVDQVAKHLSTTLPFLKTMEGVDLDKVATNLKGSDPNALPAHLREYNSFAGELLPNFIRQNVKLQKALEELSDDLATYKRQTPRMTPDLGGSADTSDEDEGLLDRFRKQFGN